MSDEFDDIDTPSTPDNEDNNEDGSLLGFLVTLIIVIGIGFGAWVWYKNFTAQHNAPGAINSLENTLKNSGQAAQ